MEAPDRSPVANYLVTGVQSGAVDGIVLETVDHGAAHAAAEARVVFTGHAVRLYQEIARYEPETRVVMRKPGE